LLIADILNLLTVSKILENKLIRINYQTFKTNRVGLLHTTTTRNNSPTTTNFRQNNISLRDYVRAFDYRNRRLWTTSFS